MEHKNLSELSDEELLKEAKKLKSAAITNAFLIGFFIGIVCYSVVKNGFGFFLIIPLFIAYKLANNGKYDRTEINRLIKERGLK